MALLAVLEADLRSLSAEARRKYPQVKDAAEHAILKLRSLPDPSFLARSEDILHIFIMACECKNVKLSAIGLACLQKWIAHGAVPLHSLPQILATLKEHADIIDETVQLKTLQTILTIFQSQLHPEDEDNMAVALGICLRLLENSKNPDSVHSTAAATMRQAVALIFDRVIAAEGLPANTGVLSRRTSRSNSVSGDVSRSIIAAKAAESRKDNDLEPFQITREQMSPSARLGLRLFEDLTSLASGASANWLRVVSLQRTFALDMIEYVLSNYVSIFKKLEPYQIVLRHHVCSLLMTSLRTTGELEGETGEPSFRRLVLRCVANVIRIYSSILITECEVFLSMLVKSINLELPLWHRIMVLEVLRGICVEARVLRQLYQTFDMRPENTNVVGGMLTVLANVVTTAQIPDASEESLVAVAGMFSSKAKGVEWSMDYDASGVAVMVASEAHAITLAIEGLLGVIFTVATLTDEAVDMGEVDSPRCERVDDTKVSSSGDLALICVSMVNSVWKTLLDALSLILSRSHGEAIVLEILKGYQAFTQACGVLRVIEPLNAFLASLCKFALVSQNEPEKNSASGALTPASGKRSDAFSESKDVILTPKNVQALRTIFNIAHRLDSVLGQSWVLVLETLALLERVIHSPHATTQEVSAVVPRFPRDSGSQSSDFNILSTLDSQLFESSAYMKTSAVCSLLAALRQISNESLLGVTSGLGQALSGNATSVTNTVSGSTAHATPRTFAVERMVAILINNLHRAELIWDQIVAHLLELAEHESSQARTVALDALDRAICAVLECDCIKNEAMVADVSQSEGGSGAGSHEDSNQDQKREKSFSADAFECNVILPLRTLYSFGQNNEVRAGALKILLHVLERHSEKLYHSWPDILELLRSVANTSEKEFVPLGFQSVGVIMNDGLMSIPAAAIDTCIEVAGAYGMQRTDVNISLTAIQLLWTSSDFFARGVNYDGDNCIESRRRYSLGSPVLDLPQNSSQIDMEKVESEVIIDTYGVPFERQNDLAYERLLLAVYGVIQGFGTDERPEIRNTAIDTLFMSISRHGHRLPPSVLEHCLWNLIFPLVDTVWHLASTSSKDEWQGRELGTQRGKPVHMLVHHSRNTAQKQWDETLVFVLCGLRRLLKHLFQLLVSLKDFKKGWDDLFNFMKENIVNSNKEVAFAAITSLHIVLITHASKGCMPVDYFETAMSTYEAIILGATEYQSKVVVKARQELLRNIAELYKQAHTMFQPRMYLRLLGLVDVFARCPVNAIDRPSLVQESIPLVQQTVLEILPMIKPMNDLLSSVWPVFLQQIAAYLTGDDALKQFCREDLNNVSSHVIETSVQLITGNRQGIIRNISNETNNNDFENSKNGIYEHSERLSDEGLPDHLSQENMAAPTETACSMNPLFLESIVMLLKSLYQLAPFSVRFEVLPDIFRGLGRCMCTRRDAPHGSLWRSAITAFNSILIESLDSLFASCFDEENLQSGPGRPRFWKELADIYETFLVGCCGRASITLSTDSRNGNMLKEDEMLEDELLFILCSKVLHESKNVPLEVVSRLIDVLDRCASRTSALPLESVELLPAHCSRFSFRCLRAVFTICRYDLSSEIPAAIISKVAIPILVARCDYILQQFCRDESEHGDASLPISRLDEIILVLQELARLTLHPDTTLQKRVYAASSDDTQMLKHHGKRAHLTMLYGSLCGLVMSREIRIRELLLVLLRLIGSELQLNVPSNITPAS